MHRTAVVATMVIGLACWPAAVGEPTARAQDETLWWTGQVIVQSDAIHRTTVVTVDSETDTALVDGLVDQAFRVQNPSLLVYYRGRAAVGYAKGHLVILSLEKDASGFGFAVSTANAGAALDGPIHAAVGISRFWSDSLGESVDETLARLLVPRCTSVAGLESLVGCASCDAGGPGASECGLPDELGYCEARCGDGYYACCNYPNDCGCCPDIE